MQHEGCCYRLKVLDVQPQNSSGAVSLAGDLDLEVDFALPTGSAVSGLGLKKQPYKQRVDDSNTADMSASQQQHSGNSRSTQQPSSVAISSCRVRISVKQWSKASLHRTAAFQGTGQVRQSCSLQRLCGIYIYLYKQAMSQL